MTTRNSPALVFRRLVLALAVAGGAACATAPGVEKEAKPSDLEALQAVGAKAGGLVVWTSSRAGLPHLFTMKTDGSDVRQLTKGEHTDWYPRFSPDGHKILFCRSKAKGFVSEREASAPDTWNLFTINVDGSEQKKVLPDASWGNWINADEIVFLRGTKVMRAKLAGEGAPEETEIVDTATQGVFSGAIVQQPQLSPDGKYLALTLTGGRRQVGIWKIKKKVWTQIGGGSQLSWAADGASVTWVNPSGRELATIFRMPVEHGLPAKDLDRETLPLVDTPGKRSREAFPRLSPDGKWLVFGAAINGRELDVEDYELYLWEVGTPVETSARLTFHTSNDSWPDILVGAAPATGEASKAPGEEEDKKEASAPQEPEPKAKTPAEDEGGEKAEPESASKANEASTGDESAATDEAAPSKAKGKGKPQPKAKKKHR
jgi:hypothetical protein